MQTSLFHTLIYRIFLQKHLDRSLHELTLLEARHPDARARTKVPYEYLGYGFFQNICPETSHSETRALFERIYALNPAYVLDVGTAEGGLLYMLCQAASQEATLISAEPPTASHGYIAERAPLYQRFRGSHQHLHLLRDELLCADIPEKVRAIMGTELSPLDLLVLRAHDIEKTFALYSPLVKKGGLIAILGTRQEASAFWNTLRRDRDCEDLLPEKPRLGIGLLRV